MANWYGQSRSNYFKVLDEVAFREWAESRDLEVMEKFGGLLAIAPSSMSEDGSWPSSVWDEDNEEYVNFDFFAEVAEHLAEGQVAVLMTIGNEKLRYLTGFAVALAWDGRRTTVDIYDIYDKVLTEFGVKTTAAEY